MKENDRWNKCTQQSSSLIQIRFDLRILYSNLIRDSSEILVQMGERRGARGEEKRIGKGGRVRRGKVTSDKGEERGGERDGRRVEITEERDEMRGMVGQMTERKDVSSSFITHNNTQFLSYHRFCLQKNEKRNKFFSTSWWHQPASILPLDSTIKSKIRQSHKFITMCSYKV